MTGIAERAGPQADFQHLGLGYFGASTGAAAALTAAEERLEIVGENDRLVLDLDHSAIAPLARHTEHKLEIIAGAGHLFEGPGTLDLVAVLAGDWFRKHLAPELLRHRST